MLAEFVSNINYDSLFLSPEVLYTHFMFRWEGIVDSLHFDITIWIKLLIHV